MKLIKGYKCHFHDKLCPLELPYCEMCKDNPPDEEKPNGKKPPIEFVFPYCPACGEPAYTPYSHGCCIFCGQHFIQKGDEQK